MIKHYAYEKKYILKLILKKIETKHAFDSELK